MLITIKQGPPHYTFKDLDSDKTLDIMVDYCILCGQCEPECPTGAIVIDDNLRFYTGSCEMVGDCASVCPTQALVFNDCNAEINYDVYPVKEYLGAVTVSTTERLFSWIILRNTSNLWYCRSNELATLKQVTKSNGTKEWQFENLEHKGVEIIGTVFGVSVEVFVNPQKTIGLYNAGMRLVGTCKLSAVCKGFPITSSYSFDVENIFSI